jgi:AhpD family alkylhydroperoxidase
MTTTSETPTTRLPLPADGSSHRTYQPALSDALMEVQGAIIRHCELDPVTMELIRIRCANVHDCRVCRSVRSESARVAGADETFLEKAQSYETSDLSERHKVVLRLADAHIFGSVPASLPDQVAAHLTPEEALDVVLIVAKCSYQKSLVALALDAPGSYTRFEFDPQTGRNVPVA